MKDPKTALIIVDMQNYFVDPHSALSTVAEQARPFSVARFCERVEETVVPAIQGLLGEFRKAQRPIFYTQFARNGDEGLPRWAQRLEQVCMEATGAPAWPRVESPNASIITALAPHDDDTVVRKTTAGAVSSSDLAERLRAAGAQTVLVCGVHTDVCVGQTARELADQDFDVWMIEDGCTSHAPDGHEAALETFRQVFGDVATAHEAKRLLGPD